MTFKVAGSAVKSNDDTEKEVKPFEKDESDNKVFKCIQVKDISTITTDDCVGNWDFDTTVWKACANMENKYITITHKEEGWSEDLKNITTFKGLGNGIKKGSWLDLKNLEREAEGKQPYTVEDFVVENKSVLKMDYDKAVDQAKIQIYLKVKQVKQQYGIKHVNLCLGEGHNFRNDLALVRPYKGNRNTVSRPIILKDIREWVLKELKSELAKEGFETDDLVEHYGWAGYLHYLKHGKFNHLVIASDKDAKNNPKLLVDPDTYTGENNPLQGKFKFPQAMLVLDSNKDCGDIEIVPKTNTADFKFYGFKGLLWQAFLSSDGADNYNCLGHLKTVSFGDESAYKLLKPCKTAKEALQATIDKFAELLPYGVQYTTHNGEELDVDTMTYMNTYFKVAYMTRSYNDSMDFYKLCDSFGVDTSKIKENNKLTPPERVYVGHEGHVIEVGKLIQEILTSDMKGIKTMKKADQGVVIDTIKEKLSSIDFESHYEMKQYEK